MLNYIPFYSKIWSDPKIKKLSGEATMLFIYLFANESITLTGIYELDMEICEVRLKNKVLDFDKALQEIIDSKLIEWDSDNSMVWVVNRFKLIPSTSIEKSPKVIAGVMNELNAINHQFKEKFLDKYGDLLHKEAWRLNDTKDKYGKEYFMQADTLFNLSKHYDNKKELKKFLMNRGCQERRIDEILPMVLPNLK